MPSPRATDQERTLANTVASLEEVIDTATKGNAKLASKDSPIETLWSTFDTLCQAVDGACEALNNAEDKVEGAEKAIISLQDTLNTARVEWDVAWGDLCAVDETLRGVVDDCTTDLPVVVTRLRALIDSMQRKQLAKMLARKAARKAKRRCFGSG